MSENKSKEELRKERREARMRRHITTCPHCGKEVLDHMTECPHCKGELTPRRYRPFDKKTMKILKIVGYTVVIAAAVVVVALFIVFKK